MILKPLKIFTVFLHEFGHASAAVLSCNRVTGIEVYSSEGGLAHFSSTNMKCAQRIVAPAGYLGSSFWGCAILIACAWSPEGPRGAAITLIVMLILALVLTLTGTGACAAYHHQLTTATAGSSR